MTDHTHRRSTRGTLALTALLGLGLMTLTACDQSPSSPGSTTTPAANTTTSTTSSQQTPETPAAEQVVLSETQASTVTQTQMTPDEARAQQAARERANAERAGTVFSDDPNAQPRIMVDGDTTAHAGRVWTKEPVEFRFKLQNVGTADLIITGITTSCGCTTVKEGLVNIPFAPGEEIPDLVVNYSPKSVGDSSKFVQVRTNDQTTPVLRLKVGAELIGLAQAVPNDIRPGELRTGLTHVVSFDIFSRDPEATVESITTARYPELIFTPLKPVMLEEDPNGYAIKIPVEITFPDTMLAGRVSSPLEIDVLATPPGESEPVKSPVQVRLFANLAGDLRFTRQFARVSERTGNTPYEFASSITTLSGREFEIVRVVTRDPKTEENIPVEVSWVLNENASIPSYIMTFRGRTPDAGPITGEVLVYTSLEDEVPARLTFTGFVPPPTPGAAESAERNAVGGSGGMQDRFRNTPQ